MSDRLDTWPSKLNRFLELSEQYAEARAELSNLENIKHTVLAMSAKESGESSVAAQQREAYASPAYAQWCRDAYAAVKKCEWVRLRLEAARLWFEMARSEESTRREEMRLAR